MKIVFFENFLFGTKDFTFILSILSIILAAYIIISKNPILSVLFLIGLFFVISLYLISIGLEFLGLVYLIVYVGAVSILFLFILMLINVRVSELLVDINNNIPLAILTVLIFNICINGNLPYNFHLYDSIFVNTKIFHEMFSDNVSVKLLSDTNDSFISVINYINENNYAKVNSKSWDGIITVFSHITSIGNILYTNLFIPFIIISLILLLAMVGAIIITLSKKRDNNLEWNLTSPSKPSSL